jgi:hypothetical protein
METYSGAAQEGGVQRLYDLMAVWRLFNRSYEMVN